MYHASAVFRFIDSHATHRLTTLTLPVATSPVLIDTDFTSAFGLASALIPLLENVSESRVAGWGLTCNYDNTDLLGVSSNNDDGLIMVFESDSIYDRKKTIRVPAFVKAMVVNGNVNLSDAALIALYTEIVNSGVLGMGAVGSYTFKTAYVEKP